MKTYNPGLQQIKDKSGLTPIQDILVTMLTRGYSKNAIAELTGKTYKSIEHGLYRAFEKIRAKAEELGLEAGDLGNIVV